MDSNEDTLDRELREALVALAEAAVSGHDVVEPFERVKTAILTSGWFTEDNRRAVDDLSFGPRIGPDRAVGIGLRSAGILLRDIIHHLEEERIPDGIADTFPHLTQREWESAMRVLVMILMSFEALERTEEGRQVGPNC